jgi:hypothetical protein
VGTAHQILPLIPHFSATNSQGNREKTVSLLVGSAHPTTALLIPHFSATYSQGNREKTVSLLVGSAHPTTFSHTYS